MLPRDTVAEEVKALSQEDRAKLRALGARFGAFNVYVPALLKPAPTELRLLLWALNLQKEGKLDPAALPQPPGQGLTSASFDRSTPQGLLWRLRLPHLRLARRAHRHAGAPGRPDPRPRLLARRASPRSSARRDPSRAAASPSCPT